MTSLTPEQLYILRNAVNEYNALKSTNVNHWDSILWACIDKFTDNEKETDAIYDYYWNHHNPPHLTITDII